ncbi:swi5-dependent recombination DNA repair protein 1 homolog [Clytia hemisphaerica]|uniref:Swi5-dependent recombination DNA repair protein 1 homolog n=1 Tax=Clytia hemisphaerica TaxID=252671 RepID=A0A7M5X3J4_9CNID
MEGDDEKKNKGVSEKPQSEESEALSERFNEDEQVKILKKEKEILKKQVEEKEEMIRKLKMVKMYRNKHNLEELDNLIHKWRDVAQEASQQLYDAFNEPKPEMGEFLNQLHIQHDMIGFDADTECFR